MQTVLATLHLHLMESHVACFGKQNTIIYLSYSPKSERMRLILGKVLLLFLPRCRKTEMILSRLIFPSDTSWFRQDFINIIVHSLFFWNFRPLYLCLNIFVLSDCIMHLFIFFPECRSLRTLKLIGDVWSKLKLCEVFIFFSRFFSPISYSFLWNQYPDFCLWTSSLKFPNDFSVQYL